MSWWLNGWAGDHAGSVVGRELNRLLVTVTTTGASDPPAGLFQKGDLDGTPWYWNCWVDCLTPNARAAIATDVKVVTAHVYSIEVAEWDWGDGKDPWVPGVHLFSVQMLDQLDQSATFATAVIADTLHRLAPEALKALAPAVWAAMRDRTQPHPMPAGRDPEVMNRGGPPP